MTNTLILGANGTITRMVEENLLKDSNQHLDLYLRDDQRLGSLASNPNVTIVEGDVLNEPKLQAAMKG